jgi:hypothetical protein
MPSRNDEPSVLEGCLNRQELAAELGVSERTVVRYEHAGLPVVRRGRQRFYWKDKTRAWLRGEQALRAGK